jgi:hypothetical protein
MTIALYVTLPQKVFLSVTKRYKALQGVTNTGSKLATLVFCPEACVSQAAFVSHRLQTLNFKP